MSPPVTAFADVNSSFEHWMRSRGPVVEHDLKIKHAEMAKSPLAFLRATFFRWAGLWPRLCPELTDAPLVLGVGDLHVENFGTWRDAEGRLIWGVNDLDEATVLPYAADLVRLAASALLLLEDGALSAADICQTITEGYRDWLAKGGRPFVLEENHGWLRTLVLDDAQSPDAFWRAQQELPVAAPSVVVRDLLSAHLPPGAGGIGFVSRAGGLGSRGRQRFAALADWNGARVGRELKAALPSAWGWAQGRPADAIRGGDLLASAVRSPDPALAFILNAERTGGWVVRRLGPRCGRVELGASAGRRDDRRLLRAMGRETANLHLGTAGAASAVCADLDGRDDAWLRRAAQAMADATRADWKSWSP